MLYVVEGEGTLVVGEDELVGGPGLVALVPAGTNHQVANGGTERLTVLSVHAPPA